MQDVRREGNKGRSGGKCERNEMMFSRYTESPCCVYEAEKPLAQLRNGHTLQARTFLK